MTKGATAALLVTALVVAAPFPALAAARRVTLHMSTHEVRFGRPVTLSGRIVPAAAGERVRVVDGRDRVVARPTTDRDGRYSIAYRPRRWVRLQARWNGRSSGWRVLRVRPFIRTRLRHVVLFGRARVRGVLRPGHGGAPVRVRLLRNGKVVRSRRVVLDGRRYSASFAIKRPGSYRARASFDDDDHARASDRSPRRRTRLPALSKGARGSYVKRLERRLKRLGYFIRGVDRRYDFRTKDVLRAFHKVQGMARVASVSAATWRALASPRRLRPRSRTHGLHIEIHQTKQVLFTVRAGRVARILHTSTGRGGATRDGVWRVFRKIAGYSPSRLYYPSYFDGLRAIHGWPDVPPSPASHGCARVPMWAAKWIFRKAAIGTEVRIYH